MHDQPPLYVTGADARYWRCLYQLLRAVQRKGWHTGAGWVAYDLGMTPDQRATLERAFAWVRWDRLDLGPLPPHYAPEAGSYAWKPEVFWHEVRRARGPVIWMDSANLPLGRPDDMLAHIRRHGLYLLRGQAPLRDRCDPAVLRRMQVPERVWDRPECVSGLVGVDAANPAMRKIIETWAKAARDPALIRPEKRIERHMNDQAILNAIIAEPVFDGAIILPEKDVDISSGRPVPFLSTRNKVRGDVPMWADFWVRAYYRMSKAVDQFLHRIKAE